MWDFVAVLGPLFPSELDPYALGAGKALQGLCTQVFLLFNFISLSLVTCHALHDASM